MERRAGSPGANGRRQATRKASLQWGTAAAAFGAGAVLATWPLAGHLGSGVYDFGDPLLNAWILAWVAHGLAAGPTGIFDANIFFPEPNALAFSESLIVPGLVSAPLAWLGADPVLVHNTVLLAGYVASGLAVFGLVRYLTGSTGAALVAGAAFTMLPLRMEYLPKVQLQLAFWIPLALWRLHLLVDRGWIRDGVMTGLFLALQAYTCFYHAVYGGLFAAVAGVVLLSGVPRSRGRGVAGGLLAGAVVFATLVTPLAVAMRDAADVVGTRQVSEIAAGSAEPGDYLSAHPVNWLHGDAGRPGAGERRLFPGVAITGLALAGLASRGLVPIAYVAATTAILMLSFGVNVPVYPWLFDHLEPMRALRVPARAAMFVSLGLCVLGGIGLERLRRQVSRTLAGALFAVAITAIVAEGRTAGLEYSELPEASPAVYRWLAQLPEAVICEYPLGNLEGRAGPQDSTYQYYSTIHWHRLVNGYSGFEPPGYVELRDRLAEFPSDAGLEYLQALGVEYLLVHSRYYIRGTFESDVHALRRLERVEWIGRFRWKDGATSEVFRFAKSR